MMEFNLILQPLGIKYSTKQCEQNALKNCSDLNDLRSIFLLNCYEVDD